MGIPLFRKKLLEYLDSLEIEKPIRKGSISGLYFDANSIIHAAAGHLRISGLDDEETKKCCELIVHFFESIINFYRPVDVLYIAVDGPVPMAKIQEQRSRRYGNGVSMQKDSYNSSFITPGTKFMFALHEHLVRLTKEKNKFRSHVQTVIYSSCFIPGEGEHKIMNYIRTNREKILAMSGSHLVYGNDSDLILLALAVDMPKIYVCKDTVYLNDKSGDRIEMSKNKPLNVDALKNELIKQMGGNYILDFVFLCSLLGNDFLPKSPMFSSIGNSIKAIITLIHSHGGLMNIHGEVVMKNFIGIMETLSTMESFKYIPDEESNSTSMQTIMKLSLESKDDKYVSFRSPILKKISKVKKNSDKDKLFASLWYSKMFPGDGEHLSQCVGNACISYIRGLYWVYSYYIKGQDSVTWLWYYSYHYAPLFKDLRKTLSNTNLIKKASDVKPIDGEIRFTPIHQLVSVMPWQSQQFIPSDLVDMFYTASSPLMHILPVSVIEDTELTEVEHQSKTIVPFADYYSVMEGVSEKVFPSSFLDKYRIGDEVINTLKELDVDRNRRLKEEEYKKRRFIGQETATNVRGGRGSGGSGRSGDSSTGGNRGRGSITSGRGGRGGRGGGRGIMYGSERGRGGYSAKKW